ncbi:peroxisomal trans-2-enoyl-CoA reductase-like isoform X6 [Macrobrachium rosenbergii]|uniref:peroxisomal trans-2-enoyl-CoA reductase-like isoform X6 n=2 Tax=Macrobrachium rosenbergii TaxID=79674 RepID=UPI0034D3C11F
MKRMSIFRPGLFKGKVAIVTGGGSGIGKAITEELVTLGCRVVIASRNEDKLKKASQEMDPKGQSVFAKVCNIRKEDQVKTLVSQTVNELGRIDYLVNNGGGQFPSPVADMSLKGWNAVVETNLTGTFLMCREVYEQWMCENGGVIVNIIADMFRGFPMMAHTGAARSAVDNLTKVASATSFLLSPGASFISGATLRVDGGGSLYSPLIWQIPEHENLPAYKWTYSPTPEEDTAEEESSSPKAKM